MTFTQWLVLDAARRLISESGDALSQVTIAEHIDLDQVTVSRVMANLSRRGLVSREPGFGSPTYRIWLTPEGESAAIAGLDCVRAVSVRGC